MKSHILVVEDDPTTLRLLGSLLSNAGYQVSSAADGATAIVLLENSAIGVVVSDIHMREIDGVEVLNAARNRTPPAEVILMTGYGSMETAVAALRMGAYNYLLKPYSSDELLDCVAGAVQRHSQEQSRIEAVKAISHGIAQLQQAQAVVLPAEGACAAKVSPVQTPAPRGEQAGQMLRIGDLHIDILRHEATFAGQAIHLTRTEFAILLCLAQAQQQLVSYREIVAQSHGYDVEDDEAQELLKTHMRNLRRKIPPEYLVTVRNNGYILAVPETISD